MAKLPKALVLAAKLKNECESANAFVRYSTARNAARELELMHTLLVKAREEISSCLKQHSGDALELQRRSELLTEIDSALTAI